MAIRSDVMMEIKAIMGSASVLFHMITCCLRLIIMFQKLIAFDIKKINYNCAVV